jgi:hypothetical protein
VKDLYEICISMLDDTVRLGDLIPPKPLHAYFTLRSQVAAAATYPDAFGNPDADELHEAWVYTAGVLGRIAAVTAANLHAITMKHGCWERDDCGTCGVRQADHLTAPGGSVVEVAVPYDRRDEFHHWFVTQVRRIAEADG